MSKTVIRVYFSPIENDFKTYEGDCDYVVHECGAITVYHGENERITFAKGQWLAVTLGALNDLTDQEFNGKQEHEILIKTEPCSAEEIASAVQSELSKAVL